MLVVWKLHRLGRSLSHLVRILDIARVRDAAIATRNVGDFADCGVPIVNPWKIRV